MNRDPATQTDGLVKAFLRNINPLAFFQRMLDHLARNAPYASGHVLVQSLVTSLRQIERMLDVELQKEPEKQDQETIRGLLERQARQSQELEETNLFLANMHNRELRRKRNLLQQQHGRVVEQDPS